MVSGVLRLAALDDARILEVSHLDSTAQEF
jgi:hypothetical protein